MAVEELRALPLKDPRVIGLIDLIWLWTWCLAVVGAQPRCYAHLVPRAAEQGRDVGCWVR